LRLLLELASLFFALSVIYRRLIQPFMDGMKGMKKTSTQSSPRPSKKNIEAVDPKKIQDAEFEEIK